MSKLPNFYRVLEDQAPVELGLLVPSRSELRRSVEQPDITLSLRGEIWCKGAGVLYRKVKSRQTQRILIKVQ